MSFEGYYQILCRNGHIASADCYDYPRFTIERKGVQIENDFDRIWDEPIWKCPVCGELAAWWNLVDVTNGSYCNECDGSGCKWCIDGFIDGHVELELKEPNEYCVCDKCGNSHVVKLQTYHIPKKLGHRVNIKKR